MAVRGVVVAVDVEHAVDGDAGGVGWDEDDGLLLVFVWVGSVCLAHDDVEFASRVAGSGGPPFLSFISSFSYCT